MCQQHRFLSILFVATVFHFLTCAHGTFRAGRPRLVFSSSTGRFFVRTNVKPTVSVYWDRTVQDIVAKQGPGPVKAAGAYAIMHASIFKAWRIAKTRRRFSRRCKLLAMHHAAKFALLRSFPGDRSTIIRAFRKAPKWCRHRPFRIAARRIGVRVAAATYNLYNTQIIPLPKADDDDRPSIEEWQPERVPIDSKTGPLQKPLSPEWGGLYTFGIAHGLAIKVPPPKPFVLPNSITRPGQAYTVNPAFLKQARRIVEASAALTPEQRLSAEAWEAGGGTSYPPGAWLTITQWVSARDHNTDDKDVGLFYAVANALSDAGVATWATKYKFNYARPVRVIRDLGELGFLGKIRFYDPSVSRVVRKPATQFVTYQNPKTDPSPPFAEYTSGHSGFSAAAAEVLRRWTRSDRFGTGIFLNPRKSRFEPGRMPKRRVHRRWRTFSEAADDAGMSRIYGCIHFDDGNIQGMKLGRQVGKRVYLKASRLWRRTYYRRRARSHPWRSRRHFFHDFHHHSK